MHFRVSFRFGARVQNHRLAEIVLLFAPAALLDFIGFQKL